MKTRSEQGFTIAELLVTLALVFIVMGLGATAVRHFWFVRSLEGGADSMQTQLRQLQQRVISESFPLVYGARFSVGSTQWGLVRYDPRDGTCTQYEVRHLDSGVNVSAATFDSAGAPTTSCETALGSTNEFLFFHSRGSATAGSVTIRQPTLDRTITLSVTALTGRVSRGSS